VGHRGTKHLSSRPPPRRIGQNVALLRSEQNIPIPAAAHRAADCWMTTISQSRPPRCRRLAILAILPTSLIPPPNGRRLKRTPMTSPDAAHDRLPRTLGLWSAAAVLVGVTIGSGIFRVPAQIAAVVPTPGAYLLVWVLGGLV